MFCVSLYERSRRVILFTTHDRARGARGDFSICRLNEDINTWTISTKMIWGVFSKNKYGRKLRRYQ